MKLSEAKEIADKIVETLSPFCEKCLIAGSIRREKPDVKDIEIVVQPKTWLATVSTSLFEPNSTEEKRLVSFSNSVRKLGTLEKGNPETGKYCAIVLPEGIKLDLFIPEINDFYRQYAIRTGSADYSWKELAGGWKKLGWCGSDKGLRKMSDCIEQKTPDGKSTWKCIVSNPELPPVWESEEHFFQWLNVKWVEPKERVI
jgi:DNA polymerase/3'-5' exonuclease PolX